LFEVSGPDLAAAVDFERDAALICIASARRRGDIRRARSAALRADREGTNADAKRNKDD
jgi:hypothetical protein